MSRVKALLHWSSRPILRASRFRTVLHLTLAVIVAALAISTREIESRDRFALSLAPTLPFGSVQPLVRRSEPLEPDRAAVPWPFTLRRGQNLTDLLTGLGLEPRDAFAAAAAASRHVDVRRLRAGEAGAAFFDGDGGLARFELAVTGKGRLELDRAGEGWTSAFRESVRAVEVHRAEGVLEDFLVAAVRGAGAPPEVAYKMSDVLQWDLDFHRDLRTGDRFEVVYEEVYLDGESAGVTAVLALRYENRGRLYEAFRFGEDGGYYDADGKPLRKMFLRSPLPFSRVTSRFSHRRFHPVLKVHRPHYGVDYGAPTGTPVRVTANGTVELAGWTKGGGRTVKVRHPNGYLTAYLHLSRYGAGIRKGKRVRQEEIIGYVGSSGLATGPHLDYRVQKNGRWIDPLKLPNVPAEPISESEMAVFAARRDELRARLLDDSLHL